MAPWARRRPFDQCPPGGLGARSASWPQSADTFRMIRQIRQLAHNSIVRCIHRSSSGHAARDVVAQHMKPTVFSVFTPLANDLGAVNLGQGFPDWESPEFVKEAVASAAMDGHNQYCRAQGHPDLVSIVAEEDDAATGMAGTTHSLDPMTDICVTVGATGAIFTAMRALVSPDDEVVLVDPAYDCYQPAAELAGAAVKRVPMRPKYAAQAGSGEGSSLPGPGEPARMLLAEEHYSLDVAAIEEALGPRTRVLVLNSPHNPTGVVLSQEDLEKVADLVLRHPRLVVVLDSVYEHCRFDPLVGAGAPLGRDPAPASGEGARAAGGAASTSASGTSTPPLPRLRSIPEVRHRCLEVGSIGKTFSCTGHKIGWVAGAPDLVARVAGVNQWSQFCVATPLQVAAARCLERARDPFEGHESYYGWLSSMFRSKAQVLVDGLLAAGLSPYVPSAGFFVMADTSALRMDESKGASHGGAEEGSRDYRVAHRIAREAGVVCIPPSPFYSGPGGGAHAHGAGDGGRAQEASSADWYAANTARFAFCKSDDALHEAARRLGVWRAGMGDGAAALPAVDRR